MPYAITITDNADRQNRALPMRDQRILEAAILSRLQHQPTTPTKAIKRLRPNPLAEFELQAGDLRALYNVEGEEFHGHKDHPVEPPGNGPKEDAG